MEDKVYSFIEKYQLLEPGDEVTVALSGGADSVALLWVLRSLAPRLGIRLRAAHFHHGIRGEEADRDAEFCRELCAQWEIPFSLGRGDAPARAAETGESLEEAARISHLRTWSPRQSSKQLVLRSQISTLRVIRESVITADASMWIS